MVIIMIIMVFLEEKRIERTIDDEREWIGARGEEGRYSRHWHVWYGHDASTSRVTGRAGASQRVLKRW